MSAPFSFSLADDLIAKEPPEARGVGRDRVRLMVIDRRTGEVNHSRFDRLVDFLRPGDLLVFNASRTLPASLNGCEAGSGPCLEVRLAEHLPSGDWLALILCQGGEPFACGLRPGMKITFGDQLSAQVLERDDHIPRLWKVRFSKMGTALIDLIYRLGKPVRYEYVSVPWDIEYYQNVYAREPGSAEMPSAGRAFTWNLLFSLQRQGIDSAYLLLHTGLSSYMDDEIDLRHPASEEEYFIGEGAAVKVNAVRRAGGRVVAVGTTVVRALESACNENGLVEPVHGYTRLRINSAHKLRAVDRLLTGLHEPEASHLDLLAAFLPARQIGQAYNEAIDQRYLWHEFGDLNLIV